MTLMDESHDIPRQQADIFETRRLDVASKEAFERITERRLSSLGREVEFPRQDIGSKVVIKAEVARPIPALRLIRGDKP